jgi:hypothetical protein
MSPKKDESKAIESSTGSRGQRLPILWETVNTFSKIIVTLLGLTVAIVSYYSGSGFLLSSIRAGAAMLGVGLLLWLIYMMVVKGSIRMMNDLARKQEEFNTQNQNGFMEFKV